MLPDFESRKEMRKVIFGDPKKGETNYSFYNMLKYWISVIGVSIIASIIYSYFN